MGDNGSCILKAVDNWDRGKSISTYLPLGRIKNMNEFSMLYYVIGAIKQFHFLATMCSMPLILSGSNTSNHFIPQSMPGTKVSNTVFE
jgi:hypothetical protein